MDFGKAAETQHTESANSLIKKGGSKKKSPYIIQDFETHLCYIATTVLIVSMRFEIHNMVYIRVTISILNIVCF